MWAEIKGDYVNKKTQTYQIHNKGAEKRKGRRCQEISVANTVGEKGILDEHYTDSTANGRYQTRLPSVRPTVLTGQ